MRRVACLIIPEPPGQNQGGSTKQRWGSQEPAGRDLVQEEKLNPVSPSLAAWASG